MYNNKRCRKHINQCKEKGIQSHIDFFKPLKCKQIYGVPMGGIGTGSIGRSFTGDFCRYQLVPGLYEHQTVEANMFTVNIRKHHSTTYQQALCTRHEAKSKAFRAWNMGYCGEYATYYALYPESWTVYDLPGQQVRLTVHQLSPVIAHNYADSSLPCTLFSWQCENLGTEELELAIMFTWQSGSASSKFELSDVSSKSFVNFASKPIFDTPGAISGVCINQKLKGMPLDYCVAVKQTVCVSCHLLSLFLFFSILLSSHFLLDDLFFLNKGKLPSHLQLPVLHGQ
jgi:non-lysosomal glucosylceramidase